MNKPISEILKYRREQSKLTQQQVADLSGISRPYIGAYEEGRAIPTIDKLLSIAESLGYNSLDLFMNLDKKNSTINKMQDAYLKLPMDKRRIVDFILTK